MITDDGGGGGGTSGNHEIQRLGGDIAASDLPTSQIEQTTTQTTIDLEDYANAVTRDEPEEVEEDVTREMVTIWQNERCSPELLPYASNVLGNILELLANQTALLEERYRPTGGSNYSNNAMYLSCLYQMEMERLKFLLTSYLKCRLCKVLTTMMIPPPLILSL